MHALRRVGVEIAIDDFGTGYASLAHLRALPIDIIKIDRSYVADETATAFIEMIVALARRLDATVTAEGIETERQLEHIVGLGCDRVQGFIHGPRKQADEVEWRPRLLLR